jgi:hypothetical protein
MESNKNQMGYSEKNIKNSTEKAHLEKYQTNRSKKLLRRIILKRNHTIKQEKKIIIPISVKKKTIKNEKL